MPLLDVNNLRVITTAWPHQRTWILFVHWLPVIIPEILLFRWRQPPIRARFWRRSWCASSWPTRRCHSKRPTWWNSTWPTRRDATWARYGAPRRRDSWRHHKSPGGCRQTTTRGRGDSSTWARGSSWRCSGCSTWPTGGCSTRPSSTGSWERRQPRGTDRGDNWPSATGRDTTCAKQQDELGKQTDR